MRPKDTRRDLLRRLYDAAVAAAHPRSCLPAALPPPPPAPGRIIVLAAGKAAASMTAVAVDHYAPLLAGAPGRLGGIAVTRIGYGEPTGPVRLVEAGHPVPDAAGVAATRDVLDLAATAGPDDLVLVLLSGGGSANWIAPAGDLTLQEKQDITRRLLRSGAAIGEINTLRKRLSRIKGGRLAQQTAPATQVTLAISDVPHDDPSVIASGPTVPDSSTLAQAQAVVARYRLDLPPAARALLADGVADTPKPGDPAFTRSRFAIIARPADALAAAAAAAEAAGYETVLLGADLEGEARDVAADHAARAIAFAREGRKVALLSGGELTVTIRGSGRGGPNQEYALALAVALDGTPGICAVAGDTDGTDGGGGSPDDPAGAFVDETTRARARAAGLDPRAMLANNDSTGFFTALDDLLVPGPTRTNVNDIRVVLVG